MISRAVRSGALLLLGLAACSDIAGTDSGVVVLEIIRPDPAVVEVGETLQLHSRALDASGVSDRKQARSRYGAKRES